MRTLVVAVAALFSSSVAAQTGPTAPTGKWTADFGETQCVAHREYGSDQLLLKTPAMGDVVQLFLVTPGQSWQAEQVDGSLATDTGEAIKVSALTYSLGKLKGKRVHLVNLTRETLNALQPAKSLRWKTGRTERHLALSGLSPLLKVMDTCVDALRKAWNVNLGDKPEAMAPPRPSAARAKANLASFFSWVDYPADAIQSNQQGLVGFILLVNEQGRVADCTIMRTSGVASLDAQSCAKLQDRARFTPARDATGKPMRDAVYGRIRWQLP